MLKVDPMLLFLRVRETRSILRRYGSQMFAARYHEASALVYMPVSSSTANGGRSICLRRLVGVHGLEFRFKRSAQAARRFGREDRSGNFDNKLSLIPNVLSFDSSAQSVNERPDASDMRSTSLVIRQTGILAFKTIHHTYSPRIKLEEHIKMHSVG